MHQHANLRAAAAVEERDKVVPAFRRQRVGFQVLRQLFFSAHCLAPEFTVCHTVDALHAAPVLPADLEQRVGDLAERADAHRVHQHLEHVAVVDHRLLQALQHRPALRRRGAAWKSAQALQLRLLLLVGRARQLERVCGTGSPCGLRKVLTPMIG